MEQYQLILLYCILFASTNCVNKYVLTGLHFTFPTIFQGWQTFVGAIVLQILITTQKLDFSIRSVHREDAALWLPGMLFFVLSIYTGSRALASLPVPVFFVFQNLLSLIQLTGEVILSSKVNIWTYVFNMVLVISSVGVARTSPQADTDGYFWVCCHVLGLGAYSLYITLMKGRLKMRSIGQLYCNYIYSMILFAPSSYYLGEALEAVKFPHLYFAKFYIGCILSGIFGVFLSLVTIQLEKQSDPSIPVHLLSAVAKILTSIVSLVVFPIHLTSSHALWLVVNMVANLCSVDFPQHSTKVENLDTV